jgi:hypothetical protein
MKHAVLAVAAILLAASAVTANAGPAPEPKEVHAQGCVQAGVEAGCLMVKDMRGGRLYNLLIKGPRPAIGDGIEFAGKPYNGLTACMQGVALEVTSWARKDSLKCNLGEPARK